MTSSWKVHFFTHNIRRNLPLVLLFLYLKCLVGASENKEFRRGVKLDVAPHYWERLAEAMAYAKCVEHDVLPKLDEASLIMKPSACRKNIPTECHNCIAELAKNQSLLIAPGKVEFFDGADPPVPLFHCTSHIGVKKSHEMDFISYFRMEYSQSSKSNLSLHNSDLLPRTFVVEKEVDGIWTTSSHQNYWLFGLDTLNQSTYRIRVTAVSPKHVYYPRISEAVKLYDKTVHTVAPKNLRRVSTTVDLRKARPSPIVLLRWESSSGHNASCDFDVHYMYDDPFKVERKKAEDAFWVRLDALGFNFNYNIKLMERFVGHESDIAELHFSIPSCLVMLNNSFDRCPPPSPRNIRVENDTGSSLRILWDPPSNHSLNNLVLTYELNVEPYPVDQGAYLPKPIFKGPVNGNQTSIIIQNPSAKGKIKISIIAKSRGGASNENSLIYALKDLTLAETYKNILIGGIVVVLMVFSIPVIVSVKYLHDKAKRGKKIKEKFEGYEKEPLPTRQVDGYWSKSEIESENLEILEVIGRGQFGLVRKAFLQVEGGKIPVAVKTLRDAPGTKESDFWKEFDILQGLERHIHIVKLIGVFHQDDIPSLVVEYCDGGDLKSHLQKGYQALSFQTRNDRRRYSPCSSAVGSTVQLQSNDGGRVVSMVTNDIYFTKNDDTCFTTLDLLSYARQIACGMEFLSINKIVHRDLAARNILVSGTERTLKIADFGLSRDVYYSNSYKMNSKDRIPIKWLAIECLEHEVYTTKSDVWSFGIVLYEIVTLGGHPYPSVENDQMFDKIKSGYRMPKPNTCSEELYKMMLRCWEENPNLRPDFSSLRHKLENIIETSNYVTYLNFVSGISHE